MFMIIAMLKVVIVKNQAIGKEKTTFITIG
jgi:hypothetical protein